MEKIFKLLVIALIISSCQQEKEEVSIASSSTEQTGIPTTKASAVSNVMVTNNYNHLVTLTNFTIFESGKFLLMLTKDMAKELNISEDEYNAYLEQLDTML